MASELNETQIKDMKLEENAQTNGAVEEEELVVTPWDVSTKSASGVDYDKLISKHTQAIYCM